MTITNGYATLAQLQTRLGITGVGTEASLEQAVVPAPAAVPVPPAAARRAPRSDLASSDWSARL